MYVCTFDEEMTMDGKINYHVWLCVSYGGGFLLFMLDTLMSRFNFLPLHTLRLGGGNDLI
jgi:hypothetical protein